ncbi:LysM peptidoglycan-binding domain-containing protein, partial [Rhodanobacter koreensis]
GSLVNGQIVLTPATYENTTYANQYDAAGNVAVLVTDNAGVTMSQSMEYDQRNELVETDYALSAGQASLGAQQRQSYDADGHLLSTYQYLNNQASQSVYGTIDVPDGYVTLSTAGWVYAGETSTYNADGVVTGQVSLVNPNTNWVQVVNRIEQGGTAPVGTDPSRLALGSTTTYTAFDHADNVTAYSFASSYPSVFGANYTVSYLKKDGYLQQSTTGTPTVSGYVPATDTVYYDAFGRTLAVAQTSQGNSGAAQNTTRAYAYNTAGEILEERSGTISGTTLTPTNGYFANHYTYVNGQQVSDMDEEGEIGVATTLTGFSTSTQGYVIQVGDTLASIAQTVYGNSNYGYIIGEANGLSGTSTLVPGQSITIPAVTTSSNTATTFKPYDPGSIIGSTTPNLPTAP